MAQTAAQLVDPDLFALRAGEIAAAGRFLDAHGWAPATAGNYSARLDGRHAAITVSGRHKGHLSEADVMVVDMAGKALDERLRPSAETLLHTQLLADDASVGAVLHTHSVPSTVLSMIDPGRDEIVFAGYELLKVFAGFDTHEAAASLPIFDNSQDMVALSAEVRAHFRARPADRRYLPAYLIRGHGVYAWAEDMVGALRHAEGLEFLLACELERRRLAR
ncbi:MAG TPA: methylthioribulose 1-phosphate dehydratase [Alphaproteobacteria bacterium]|jgi:methylthioribulose-1-phosphate dehydratase